MGCCSSKAITNFKAGTKFEEIKKSIRALDVILFSKDSSADERGMLNWSHCGVVVTKDILPLDTIKSDVLYLLESISVNNSFGVQIRELEKVVDEYDNNEITRVGWAPITNNPLVQKATEKMISFLEKKKKITEELLDFYNTYSKLIPKNFSDNKTMDALNVIYKIIGALAQDTTSEQLKNMNLLSSVNSKVKTPIEYPPVIITRNWQGKPLAKPKSNISQTTSSVEMKEVKIEINK